MQEYVSVVSKISPQDILKKVSRSFALTIPMLDDLEHDAIQTQYLLARVIDTIEDSTHSLANKMKLMQEFLDVLRSDGSGTELVNRIREKVIDEHDLVVIDNLDVVLAEFRKLEASLQKISIKWLDEMGQGMGSFLSRKIHTFSDLDEYCYYVAGTVGCYLTQIMKYLYDIELDVENAKSFGRYLQKINIVKDVMRDHQEGRHFWPEVLCENSSFDNLILNSNLRLEALNRMIQNILEEKEASFEYVMSIPYNMKGYRKFCTVALVMGIETLRVMNRNDVLFTNPPVKISKTTLFEILSKVKIGFYTNERLREYSQKIKI